MAVRERLSTLARCLHERDAQVCGEAPAWIIEKVASNADALLREEVGAEELPRRVSDFVLGAARFIADQCGSECDTLWSALASLEEGAAQGGEDGKNGER